jgi:hypothetical protein
VSREGTESIENKRGMLVNVNEVYIVWIWDARIGERCIIHLRVI